MTGTERRWLKSQGLDWRKVRQERIDAAREKERLEREAFLNRDRAEEAKRWAYRPKSVMAFHLALASMPDGTRRS